MFDKFSNQKGRSMIEMLGVLAIIGVLSIGGIAAYSKAMMQYKINKTVSQTSFLVQGIREMVAKEKRVTLFADNWVALRKLNILPEEMWQYNELFDTEMPTNAFGGVMMPSNTFDSDHGQFSVIYSDLPAEACIALATYDWGSENEDFFGVGISPDFPLGNCDEPEGYSPRDVDFHLCSHMTYSSGKTNVSFAAEYCSEDETNWVSLIFRY